MTHDEPLCMDCKNYEGCRLCKAYGECPENIFGGDNCEKYIRIREVTGIREDIKRMSVAKGE